VNRRLQIIIPPVSIAVAVIWGKSGKSDYSGIKIGTIDAVKESQK